MNFYQIIYVAADHESQLKNETLTYADVTAVCMQTRQSYAFETLQLQLPTDFEGYQTP